jgi:hypothetical protein
LEQSTENIKTPQGNAQWTRTIHIISVCIRTRQNRDGSDDSKQTIPCYWKSSATSGREVYGKRNGSSAVGHSFLFLVSSWRDSFRLVYAKGLIEQDGHALRAGSEASA